MIALLAVLAFAPLGTPPQARVQSQPASQQLDCRWDDKAMPCEMKATTAHYVVAVYNKCKEGTEYTCNDYVYSSVSRDGKRFTLPHGRMTYQVCATNNVTPCTQTGWSFRNGTTEYTVSYPEGTLEVWQNQKLLLREAAVKTEP